MREDLDVRKVVVPVQAAAADSYFNSAAVCPSVLHGRQRAVTDYVALGARLVIEVQIFYEPGSEPNGG
jgi:hypothetical protein